jgi:hypothetical protein
MLGERSDQVQSERPRFPALDPEPSRSESLRRRLRNCAVAVIAIVVLAGLGGLAAYLVGQARAPHSSATRPAPGTQTRPASAAPAGTVLSQTAHGPLVLSGLRGQRSRLLMSLPSEVYVAAADGRYVATSNGLLLSIGAHGLLSSTHMRNVDASAWSPTALADHDQYVALQYYNSTNSQADGIPVSITSLVTGKFRTLGVADTLSGDPAAAGVIASLPAPPVATSTPTIAPSNGQWPDGRVVIRDAGKKDVLLGTAAQFNQDVGLPATAQTDLSPQPSPSGGMIAIVVQPIAGHYAAGVVVVTRAGRELFALHRAGRSVSAVWSPSGQSLAMIAQIPHGSVLAIWKVSDSTSASQRFPGTAGYGACVWSPDGAWILCAVTGQHSSGEQWAVASARGGPMVVTTGPGYPVQWLATGQ